MKPWEFLLQKEGDRTWLPLEPPTVEILEGRYRVVARTPCQGSAVDIYVSYVSSADEAPKRRVQQRSHEANHAGLLAILPFTRFRPGRWELRCRPQSAPGEAAQRWQSQIELQVLSQVDEGSALDWDPIEPSEASEAGDRPPDPLQSGRSAIANTPLAAPAPDWAAPDPTTPESPPPEPDPTALSPSSKSGPSAAVASAEALQRLADEMSQMVLASVLGAAGLETPAGSESPSAEPVNPSAAFFHPGDNPAGAEPTLSESSADPGPGMVLPDLADSEAAAPTRSAGQDLGQALALRLLAEVVTFSDQRSSQVSGSIVWEGAAPPLLALPPMILTLELRDPGTREIWASQRQSLDQLQLPQAFDLAVQLPSACQTQLLLGNVSLWQSDRDGTMTTLASKTFQALAPLDQLLSQVSPALVRGEGQVESSAAGSPAAEETGASPQSSPVQNLQQQAASNFLVTKFGMAPTLTKGNVQINTELLNLLNQDEASPRFRQTGRQVLPPRLGDRPSSPGRDRPGPAPTLDLPSFGRSGARSGQGPNPETALPAAVDAAAVAPLAPVTDFPSADGPAPDPASPVDPASEPNLADLAEQNPFEIREDSSLADLDELMGQTAAAAGPAQEGGAFFAGRILEDSLGSATAVDPLQAQLELLEAADGVDASDDLAPAGSVATPPPAATLPPHPSLALGSLAEADAAAPMPSPTDPMEPDLASIHLSREVVVEDELPPASAGLAWMRSPSPDRPSQPVDIDIAVPEPQFTLPERPLVQGESLRILVRVAQQPANLCARLWLLDCQSRQLLGEPQWITTFLPLGDDLMEASLDLVVPEGSIELQVEAIAVEPNSQRESLKISTRRTVVMAE